MNECFFFFREAPGTDCLLLETKPLSDLEGHTVELIGTNINGNPYGRFDNSNKLGS